LASAIAGWSRCTQINVFPQIHHPDQGRIDPGLRSQFTEHGFIEIRAAGTQHQTVDLVLLHPLSHRFDNLSIAEVGYLFNADGAR
jgi:hypothetical protein